MMMRTIDFRFRVIRNGGDYCLLHPADNSKPCIRMDDSGDIKTLFTGSFLAPEKEVNWLTDEIRPELILNGVTHRLGVFLPAIVSETDDGVTKSIPIEAYDRGWLARDCRVESRPFFAAGTNYLSAVSSILTSAGIIQIIETPTEAVLAEDREDWEVGTSCLDIANQLLDEINYEHIWFDRDGACILEPVAVPSAQNIEHTLDENNVESMLSPGMSNTTDFYSTPNVFICICSNADKGTVLTATAENTNPQSPLSIARRGRRIAKVVQVNNIASQEELQLYANRLVTDTMFTGETVRVQTALLPGFGVGDTVALQYGDIFSVCRERSWNMQLTVGGKMTHTLEKVVYNLD